MNRAIKDEKPSESTCDDWRNDAIRVKEFFADIPACDIELEHVNAYINKYHAEASANVQNRKVSFLKKLFSYAVDESLMLDNPATRKKMRRIDEKRRQRLSLDNFLAIRRSAAPWLRTAMDLALQTTHARLEVSRIRYSIKEPKTACVAAYGWISRRMVFTACCISTGKSSEKEASHVAIPIGGELKRIIDDSRDNVASPYIVHRIPARSVKPSKEVSHPTQVAPTISAGHFQICVTG